MLPDLFPHSQSGRVIVPLALEDNESIDFLVVWIDWLEKSRVDDGTPFFLLPHCSHYSPLTTKNRVRNEKWNPIFFEISISLCSSFACCSSFSDYLTSSHNKRERRVCCLRITLFIWYSHQKKTKGRSFSIYPFSGLRTSYWSELCQVLRWWMRVVKRVEGIKWTHD